MNREMLLEGFRALGIQKNSVIMVHSSLKSFGYVEGGAETVAKALIEAVPEGTVMLPTFNHGVPYDNGEIFDIRSTPTINGAIPEAFRKLPGVHRSMNPTHPFAIYGKNSREIALAHEKAPAMGENSPLDYLYKNDGCILLLGVDFRRNTFHHYVETVLNSPCLLPRGEEYDVIDENGQKKRARTWSWREKSCPIDDAALYMPLMKPYEKVIKLGSCFATYFRARDCFNVVEKCLKEGLEGFPGCADCPIRPRKCIYSCDAEE